MRSSTTIVTDSSHRYLAQLCKHPGHRVPAICWANATGQISFDAGEVHLRASPATR